ncbi:MAG: hypothetical protein KDK26_15765 [Roseivivax sp.]|nr:hypothetical protein [Roseivivax sp.]
MHFSPSEIEELTGWPVASQRDLRRRGLIRNYGEATNGGRWRYDLRDLVAFYVAFRLHAPGTEGLWLSTILATSWTNAPKVIAEIRGERAPGHLLVFQIIRPHDMEAGGSHLIEASSTAEIVEGNFDEAHIINYRHIAETARADIKKLIRAAD